MRIVLRNNRIKYLENISSIYYRNPDCQKCKYFYPPANNSKDQNLGVCKLFGLSSYTARNNSKLCGKNGIYFE